MAHPQNLSCVLYGPGKVRFEQRPLPVIADAHHVLVRIAYVGVCGTDVRFWTHGGMIRTVSEDEPLVMGHEASGVVHAVGPSVTRVRPGDRVVVEPGFPCHKCKLCLGGRYNLCPHMKFAADPPQDGTLSCLYRVAEQYVFKIPSLLTLQEAVLVEPLSVAVHGARLSPLEPGRSILVQGSGTVGLLTAATALAFGAGPIFISDINQAKLDFAKTFIECWTFVPDAALTPGENAARFKKRTGQRDGVDIVFECTGSEPAIQTGLHALAAGGTFVQIGIGKSEQVLPLTLMCEKEVNFQSSFRYGPGDFDLAIRLLEAQKFSVKSFISSVFPFHKAAEAWEETRQGRGVKNLIQVTGD
ncbi:alcohol dehydrogenase [Metarhizium album ARSEF 1941]|uniref:L-arabinitol 4-dehydrogenase n=1 Tax=Metarhizium album (strain ARSEF 1941) TaxID=1081103 RepID=A0A0B2WPQ2_METAS|nr:alcohol dehydrogenase [Metarhizium album ARSEF 1941]KHN98021.1 alcohol dehydrogenase [Metarhizium album ARSEF 1941]